MGQRNAMVTAILASLTTRQTLRREWHARLVPLGRGLCCFRDARAVFGRSRPLSRVVWMRKGLNPVCDILRKCSHPEQMQGK